ncbi:MAG: hypothetical protein K6T91_09065 [Firmicutes bacterium]|nr:hypothetical protein [Bacillota bacterium]
MPLFSLRSNEPRKLAESTKLNPEHVKWLEEQIAFHGSVLPENFLVIDMWKHPACSGLLALDQKASLAVLLIASRSPHPKWIEDAADFAWQMRYASYADLDEATKQYLASHGVSGVDLSELHQQHFAINRPLKRYRFNQNQRVLLLAPEFLQDAIEKISWRRFEIDIEGYIVKFIKNDSRDDFLHVEPAGFMETGKIALLASTIASYPSSITRRWIRI